MVPVSSTLELCPSCRDAIADVSQSGWSGDVNQSREDFLDAQHKCYICTWIWYSLESQSLGNVVGDLRKSFDFFFYHDEDDGPKTRHGRLVLRMLISYLIPTYGVLAIKFFSTDNAEYTSSLPPATSDFPNSQFASLAENWITKCRQNHTKCTPAKKEFRPTRLVEIIDKDHGKLVLSEELSPDIEIEYVALSHCWGGDKELLTLSSSNELELREQIDGNDLPRTFREAIKACVELGFRYIWIDSLCIRQDKEDQADWLEQAAQMDSVYENAVLNLCMAGSANPSERSLSARDSNLLLPLSINLTDDDGKEMTLHLVCDGMFEHDIEKSPLRKRAWVFQEWYLAKRSLIFGRMQLWWHCCEELACETLPEGIPGSDSFKTCIGIETAETMKGKISRRPQTLESAQKLWNGLIKQYAGTNLTKEVEDRVIAFSGISRTFGKSHNIEDQYAAGLWKCHLPGALLWYRFCGGASSRSLDYKAPSWSWMSLNGPMNLEDHSERNGASTMTPLARPPRYCCSVGQLHLSLVDESNATGRLNGGSIQIYGHLMRLNSKEIDAMLVTDDGRKCDISFALGRAISIGLFGPPVYSSAEVRWDEEDDKEQKIVSYLDLDNVATELCQGANPTGCSRTSVLLEQATGSFFALPILYQAYAGVSSITDDVEMSGIVLYSPPRQPDIFYRVGSFKDFDFRGYTRGYTEDFTGFIDSLNAHSPKRSICIL